MNSIMSNSLDGTFYWLDTFSVAQSIALNHWRVHDRSVNKIVKCLQNKERYYWTYVIQTESNGWDRQRSSSRSTWHIILHSNSCGLGCKLSRSLILKWKFPKNISDSFWITVDQQVISSARTPMRTIHVPSTLASTTRRSGAVVGQAQSLWPGTVAWYHGNKRRSCRGMLHMMMMMTDQQESTCRDCRSCTVQITAIQ